MWASEAKEMLTEHMKPLNICSSWGFRPRENHRTWKMADGSPVVIYKNSGSWQHNLSIPAVVEAYGDEWTIVENSWGPRAHKNGPFFVIPADLFDRWVKRAQCMTVGEIDMGDNPPVWPEDLVKGKKK